MASKLPHYVGLTGAQTPADAEASLQIFHRYGFQPGGFHNNMVGVLTSPAILIREAPVHTNKPWRHAASAEAMIETLQVVQDRGVPMIHVELPKPAHPDDPSAAHSAKHVIALIQLLQIQGVRPAVQLNGVVPAEGIVRIAGETGAAIVLQLRKELMALHANELLRYIGEAQGGISKILMDPSAGAGTTFEPEHAVQWQRTFEDEFGPDTFTYGYAGGLDGTNAMDKVAGLVRELGHNRISTDIETKARIVQGAIDVLDTSEDGVFEQYVQKTSLGLWNTRT